MDTSVMIELQRQSAEGSVHSRMQSITQDMRYRQSLLGTRENIGVSPGEPEYNKSRSYIYFW